MDPRDDVTLSFVVELPPLLHPSPTRDLGVCVYVCVCEGVCVCVCMCVFVLRWEIFLRGLSGSERGEGSGLC